MFWFGLLFVMLVTITVVVWLTIGPTGLVFILLASIVVELFARNLVDHRLPFGWVSALTVCIAGGWLGGWYLGEQFGPTAGNLPIFPALFGIINARLLADIFLVRDRGRDASQKSN